MPCGTEINAFVNENLETIEQEYVEFIKVVFFKIENRIS